MIIDHLLASVARYDVVLDDHALITAAEAAAPAIAAKIKAGGKVMLCGNGGSAAMAQHLAAEFVGRYKQIERRPLNAIALNADTAVLTALANDFGYSEVYARQVRALAWYGDVLIVMSTSGRSSNIMYALEEARRQEVMIVGLFGRRSLPCDHTLCVPSDSTAIIQQVHLMLGHAIIGEIEKILFEATPSEAAA